MILSTVPTGSADMPPGGGSSTPGNVADEDVLRRLIRCRISSRRSIEKTNPGNLEFVCANLGYIGFIYVTVSHRHGIFLYSLFVFVYWDVAETSNSRIRSQTAGGGTTTTEPDVRLYSFLHLLVLFMMN